MHVLSLRTHAQGDHRCSAEYGLSFALVCSILQSATACDEVTPLCHSNMVQWAGDDSELCPQIQLFCKHVATNLDLKFNPDADRTSLIAALLDPRYRKLEFLEDYPLAQKSGRDALKQEWTKLQHDSSPVQAEQASKRVKATISLDQRAGFGKGKSSSTKTEFDRYMALDNDDGCTDILQWWKGHATDYPFISQLARRYLAIPASSAPSERLFSRLKDTATLKRNRMKPKTLCQLLFVQQHSSYLTGASSQ
jgi:hypothetical protein